MANVVEGMIDRVIFEGPTAQLRVDVGGRELRADVSGSRRLTVAQDAGRIRPGLRRADAHPRRAKGVTQ